MIISVPSDTQSFSIRREGDRTIIFFEQGPFSDGPDNPSLLRAEECAAKRQPQRTRKVPLPLIASVCLIVVGASLGHWLLSPAKNDGPHTAEAVQMPLLRAPEPATRRSIPASPEAAPVPNNAFGLE